MVMIRPIAAGRIASDVVATEKLESRLTPTTTAAAIASTPVMKRITSSTAIDSQAFASCPPAEYHGRKRAMISSTPQAPASHSPQLRRRGSTRGRLTDHGAAVALLEMGRLDRVDQQHRDGHGSHPARHGRDGRSFLRDGVEVHVADQAVVGAIDPHVDDDGAVTDHFGRHELRPPYRCDQDVGTTA